LSGKPGESEAGRPSGYALLSGLLLRGTLSPSFTLCQRNNIPLDSHFFAASGVFSFIFLCRTQPFHR